MPVDEYQALRNFLNKICPKCKMPYTEIRGLLGGGTMYVHDEDGCEDWSNAED